MQDTHVVSRETVSRLSRELSGLRPSRGPSACPSVARANPTQTAGRTKDGPPEGPGTGGNGAKRPHSSKRQPGSGASGTHSGPPGSPGCLRMETGPRATSRPVEPAPTPTPATRPGACLPLGVVGCVPGCLLQQSHVAQHAGEDEEHSEGVGPPAAQTHGGCVRAQLGPQARA